MNQAKGMRIIYTALLALVATLHSLGQGQVVFANRVTGLFDAPVIIPGSNPSMGPGPGYTAELSLQGSNGSLTPLTPTSTFYAPGPGAQSIADRYWMQKVVDVPVQPNTLATFVVRVWPTAFGSYDAARAGGAPFWGESAPFTITVGGGLIPPTNLTTLQAFTVVLVPEPGTVVLAIAGGLLLTTARHLRNRPFAGRHRNPNRIAESTDSSLGQFEATAG
jgi:hypothetical protein